MIRGLIESSFIDWDGKISLVIFFDKCNFRCPFCHNWELISSPEKFPVITWEKIQSILSKKEKWIDGIVLTGGEPLVDIKETAGLCRNIRKEGFLIKLDTNGAFPDALSSLIEKELIDYIAMDVKAALDESYDRATRVKTDLGAIRSSIKIIMKSALPYEFRTTCVPGLVDEKAMNSIGNTIKDAQKWALQGYRPENSWAKEFRRPLPSRYERNIIRLRTVAQQYVSNVVLRGCSADH